MSDLEDDEPNSRGGVKNAGTGKWRTKLEYYVMEIFLRYC